MNAPETTTTTTVVFKLVGSPTLRKEQLTSL